ncbi:MAG: endonuclease VII domain-containing protein [Candidatus Methylomirabilales bacterium]
MAWRDKNREKLRADNARWRRENSGRLREYRLKSIWGMTAEEYRSLFDLQNGLCAICREPPGDQSLAVDHDHNTGKVRGLLCKNCNLGIGNFRDDAQLLISAIEYLEGK